MESFTTNLPDPYYGDTTFLDDPPLFDAAVGTVSGNMILEGKEYITDMHFWTYFHSPAAGLADQLAWHSADITTPVISAPTCLLYGTAPWCMFTVDKSRISVKVGFVEIPSN